MSEMKMSDTFALPVYRGVQEVNIQNKEKPCIVSGTSTTVIARHKYIDATIHAINNHDRMVEEIVKLREALSDVIDGCSECDLSYQTGLSIARCQEIMDISAKLNQEGEE